VHLKVQIPTNLTEKQKKLIEEFAEESKDGKDSVSHKKKAGEHQSILNEAWKRLKDFLNTDKNCSPKEDNAKKTDPKENAKAKG
jgi:DnaJ-class molecular chaperone